MLRVNPSGTKSWYVQLDRNCKRKIADAGLLTASVARYRARDLLARHSRDLPARTGRRSHESLGDFLTGSFLEVQSRRSRYGARDTRRLYKALGPVVDERRASYGESPASTSSASSS